MIPHGLQKYTNKLIENGFDSVKYIHEVLDSDLVEIGVTDDWDRAKVRREEGDREGRRSRDREGRRRIGREVRERGRSRGTL